MKECSQPDCHKTNLIGRGLCATHYQRFRLNGTLNEVAPVLPATCGVCGLTLSLDRDPRRIYCSRVCVERSRGIRKRAARIRRAVTCELCGGSLAAKRPQARFCSRRCADGFRNGKLAAEVLAGRPPCTHCGGPLPPHAKRFCSRLCSMGHRRPEKYGLTRDGLAALLAQHESCAICGTDRWGAKGPQVDHDHATGRVRGVLCVNCNTMIGHAGDDPARLRAAVRYLTR